MKFNILHQVQQKIGSIRSLRIQSTTLKLLALGLAGLLGVLVLGGIQAIARVDSAPAPHSATEFAPHPIPSFVSSSHPIVKTIPAKLAGRTSKFNLAERAASQIPQGSQSQASPAAPRPAPRPAPSNQPAVGSRSPRVRPATQPASRPEIRQPRPAPAPVAAPTLAPITPIFSTPNPAVITRMPTIANTPADPTNYGDRYATDIYGRPVHNALLVVLHETVGSASSAVNTMQAPHPSEDEQVSYHSIIKRDGTVIYLVAPEKRAFGAGNSVFNGSNGPEAVKTHKDFPPSVNNFAYHISLESPDDGGESAQTHSGYSSEQYQSLAWLVAWTNVPYDRITTHRAVDQSGTRIDPRSFDGQQLTAQLQNYLRTTAQQ
jgi:N-acetylmuramoyl-L-alanine amidase